MKNIILTSCGIIDREFKEQFYRIINKEEIKDKKVLYITTASDGENHVGWLNRGIDYGVKRRRNLFVLFLQYIQI